MLNKNMMEKYLEMKRLNSNLNDLYEECKQRIKAYEKEGAKIPQSAKSAIKNMIYSIDNYLSYNLLRDNIYAITRCMPNTKSKHKEVDESLYVSLINIIASRINDESNSYMFKPIFCGLTKLDDAESIFDCLTSLDEISKQKLDFCDFNIRDLIKILEQSDSILKVQSSLILLKKINEIEDSTLANNLIADLTNIDNEKKLKQIYTVLLNNRYNFSKNANSSISQFLEYIEIEKNEKYDENLIEILKKLSDPYHINKIDPLNNNIVELMLDTNLKNCDNKNMEIVIRLLNEDFILSDNWDLRDSIIETTLDMNFLNDLHKDFYVKFMNVVVLSSNDLNDARFQHKIVDLLSKIKSTKSLELIIDIYPFINKYNDNDEKYDIINSLSNNESKGKKLVISFKDN